MAKLNLTKSGNIKIHINPERKYDGQFIGYRYYDIDDVKRAFPRISDFGGLDVDGLDIGDGATNEQMIEHHVMPFRSVGHICGA